MSWRVLADGPMIEQSGGMGALPNGDRREVTSIVVARQGMVIKEIGQSMKERYAANDSYVRSIVEYGELEDTGDEDENGEPVLEFVPKGLPDDKVPDASDTADAAVDAAGANARAEEAERQLGELQDKLDEERSTAAGRIEDLQAQVTEAQKTTEEAIEGALSYGDLSAEALKVQCEKEGLSVSRGDGKEGDPLKADYVKALEEAHKA